MKDALEKLLALALIALCGWFVLGAIYDQPAPAPAPVSPTPAPAPAPDPCPDGKCPRRPRPRDIEGVGKAVVGGRISPDGKPIQVDYPASRHLKNKGGSDGAGLCVMTANSMSGDWHGFAWMIGYRDWMTRYPGGGWPDKLDRTLKQYCAEKGMQVPDYIQVQTYDPALIRKALAAGHMVAGTYYRSPTGRYGGGEISHMVNYVHADEQWFAVLDNNFIGADQYEWMDWSAAQRSVSADGRNRCWFVIWLRQGPPPIPRAA